MHRGGVRICPGQSVRCTAGRARRRHAAGFTLLELTLAIILAGVVSTLAVNTYRNHVLRAKVAAAISDIGRIQLAVDRYALGNNGNLPPDLASVGMGGRLDPWNHAYIYVNFAGLKGKSAMRKDKNLVPINTEYDLYSMGPDGATAAPLTAKVSRDDIVRANDGGFIGVAANY